LGHLGFYPEFYLLPSFTQLPRVKLGKTVQKFYPPTQQTTSMYNVHHRPCQCTTKSTSCTTQTTSMDNTVHINLHCTSPHHVQQSTWCGHSPVFIKFPHFWKYFSYALIFIKPPDVYRQATCTTELILRHYWQSILWLSTLLNSTQVVYFVTIATVVAHFRQTTISLSFSPSNAKFPRLFQVGVHRRELMTPLHTMSPCTQVPVLTTGDFWDQR